MESELISVGYNQGTLCHSMHEENVVQEEECNGSGCHLFLVLVALELRVANEDGDEDVAECLACCHLHHEVSATPTFDVWNGD